MLLSFFTPATLWIGIKLLITFQKNNIINQNMELEEFISKTLVSIYKGVKSANKDIDNTGKSSYFNIESSSWHKDRSDGYIKFDVAVTASNLEGAKGGAGIRVWSIGIGGEKETSTSEQTVSRIKFGVAPSITTG